MVGLPGISAEIRENGVTHSKTKGVGMTASSTTAAQRAAQEEQGQGRREQDARTLAELSAREHISQDVERIRDRGLLWKFCSVLYCPVLSEFQFGRAECRDVRNFTIYHV